MSDDRRSIIKILQRSLSPRALSQDLVEVQSHRVLGDQTLDFLLQVSGQNPHQGLGSETILGALFVVTWGSKKQIRVVRSWMTQRAFWDDHTTAHVTLTKLQV